jgi:hypothetical protein
VVQRLIAVDGSRFSPGAPVHCVCLDVSLDDEDAAALRDRTLLWYENDDDVAFKTAPTTTQKLAALNLLSPSLNAQAPGSRHVVCAYSPSGTSVDDIIARARRLLRHDVVVHDSRSIDGARWNHFGPGSEAVYGRRKTADHLQRSVVGALPRQMSMAHAGAGIPGVLGCLQMAAAVVDEVAA